MKLFGIGCFFVFNVLGGVNFDFEVGEIMIQDDYINFFLVYLLIGKNIDEFGLCFLDMSELYDYKMIEMVKGIVVENNIKVFVGIYVVFIGLMFEMLVEYKYVCVIGVDVVGMFIILEVIVVCYMGILCFVIFIIIDLGVFGKIKEVSFQDVIEVVSCQELKMMLIMCEFIFCI